MYPKLSGMTGTGKTSEIEFEKIYNLVVDIIPTYRPIQRDDLSDILYKDQFSKKYENEIRNATKIKAVFSLLNLISFFSHQIMLQFYKTA